MKKIHIFPKEWLELHPYKQSSPVDSYYTGIANRIYDILVQTELANSFEEGECKQFGVRMAAYFEDVISEIGIWRSFILKHHETYGSYVPFYTPDDHYYDDEVNLEDVRFLVWHYTQQYHGKRSGTFVNPDNAVQGQTASAIYQLFCDEWTTAPENEKMQKLFAVETRYTDKKVLFELASWFYYSMYLYTDSNEVLTETVKDFHKQYPDMPVNNLIMDTYESLIYKNRTPFMALTTLEWLIRILPEAHPDRNIFINLATTIEALASKETEELIVANAVYYQKFKDTVGDQLLVYVEGEKGVINYLENQLGMPDKDINRLPEHLAHKPLALYATPEEGVQVMIADVELIKDEQNPFYNEKEACLQALDFFIVKHCSVKLLKEMMKRGMLADAQTKSLISPERGKAIIQDNWQFLTTYFTKDNLDE